MMYPLRRVLLSIIAFAMLGSSSPLHAAASDVEIITYAEMLKELIAKDLKVVVDRRIADFEQAYAGADHPIAQILRLQYARKFSVDDPSLKTRAEALEAKLKGLASDESIPAAFRSLIIREPLDVVISLTNPILRGMQPAMPPPKPELRPAGFSAELETRIQLLREAVDDGLVAADRQIAAYQDTFDEGWSLIAGDPTDENYDILFEAIRRRLNLANILYIAYKAFSEVLVRGEEFGLKPELAQEIDTWLGKLLTARQEALDEWDYALAPYNIYFKHRLLALRMIMSRYYGIPYATPSEVTAYVEDFLLTDESMYSSAAMREQVRELKEKVVEEVMMWSMSLDAKVASGAVADAAQAEKEATGIRELARRLWDERYRDFRSDLKSRNKQRSATVAGHYVQAARFFAHIAEQSEALKLMSEILAVEPSHPWSFNAKAWQTYFLTAGKGGGEADWSASPSATDPETALSLARSFRKAANNTADRAKAESLRIQAAVALRNAIYGLSTAEFADMADDFGPAVYQAYGLVLQDLDWFEQASLVAEQGLRAVEDRWGKKGNPWGDPRQSEQLTESGQTVHRLSDDFWSYSSKAKRGLDTEANADRYVLAIEMRKRFNPNAEGGEKTEIVAAIQDSEYERAVTLARGYAPEAESENDRLWFQRMIVYALYRQVSELAGDRNADDAAIAAIEQRLQDELAMLRETIAPELAKGREKGAEEAFKAKSLGTVISIAELARNKDWEGVFTALDAEFWEQPLELKMQVDMLNQLCNAAYLHRLGISKLVESDKDRQWDPALVLEPWPHYRHALAILRRIEAAYGKPLPGNQKRLANVFQAVSVHAGGFVANIESGAEDFKGLPLDAFATIAREATVNYIDLLVPTLPEDTAIETWIALAQDLWEVGAKQRAVTYYERYLEESKDRADLAAFARDPKTIVDRVGARIEEARRRYIDDYWNEIRDYLIDAPGFMEEYLKHGGSRKELKEEKRDFIKAFSRLRDFREQMEKDRALLGNSEDLFTMMDELVELVKHLAWRVQFTSRLVEAYMEIGNTERAVELAGALIEYDPLYPPYMSVYVEGVLLKGDTASREEWEAARTQAAKIRNRVQETARLRDQYWTAMCQILELSVLLGEIDLVNRVLKRAQINNDFPIFDLGVQRDGAVYPVGEGDAHLWKRFLRIYEAQGVRFEAPYSVGTDAEGRPVATGPTIQQTMIQQ